MYYYKIQLSHKAIDFVEEPLLTSPDRGGIHHVLPLLEGVRGGTNEFKLSTFL